METASEPVRHSGITARLARWGEHHPLPSRERCWGWLQYHRKGAELTAEVLGAFIAGMVLMVMLRMLRR